MGYRDIYDGWKADPEAFWLQAAQAIDWVKPPSKALNDARAPLYEWFTDATVNTCWNAVDRHVEAGRGDQVAILWEGDDPAADAKVTYRELHARVCKLANAMRKLGVKKGDRVRLQTPGGGGWGSPDERSTQDRAKDSALGYTKEQA